MGQTVLYNGWTAPDPQSVKGLEKSIEYFEKSETKLLGIMDRHEGDGHYAYYPEDRQIEKDNLAFIRMRKSDLIDRWGTLKYGSYK